MNESAQLSGIQVWDTQCFVNVACEEQLGLENSSVGTQLNEVVGPTSFDMAHMRQKWSPLSHHLTSHIDTSINYLISKRHDLQL